jgi:AcrR family transcriptional regulator
MHVTKQKSQSVSQRRQLSGDDERIRRTRARIDAAFVDLLQRRGYASIRVSDITKKAGVGRPTFYAHYATKDALLRSQFQRAVAPMLVLDREHPTRFDATHLFAHIKSAPKLFFALMGPNGGIAPRIMRDSLEHRTQQLLALSSDRSDLRQAATARFVAYGLLGTLECWLEQGTRATPAQAQSLFAGLVTPGVTQVLNRVPHSSPPLA